MSTGTIPPITGSPLTKRIQKLGPRDAAPGTVQSLTQTAAHYGSQLLNVGGPLAMIGVALAALSGSVVISTVAPDKTGIDKGAKVTGFLGALVGLWGFVKLFKAIKGQQKEPPKVSVDPLDDAQKAECRKARNTIKNFDQNFQQAYDLENQSRVLVNNFEGVSDGDVKTVRENALKLYDIYKGVIEKYNVKDKSAEPSISGVAENIVTLTELKHELALLVGNTVALRDNPDFNADTGCAKLVADGLGDDEITGTLNSVLPQDFIYAYEAARFYHKYHFSKNGSVENIFKTALNSVSSGCDLDKLAGILKGVEKDNAKAAIEVIKALFNNLKVFEQTVNYVRTKSNSSDPNEAKQAALLRQALIAGLRLNLKSSSELNKEFTWIYDGAGIDEGLEKKIKDLKPKFDEFESKVLNKSGGKYSKVVLELSGVFPGGLGLFDLQEVLPQPVT